jgi:hypothetical protein
MCASSVNVKACLSKGKSVRIEKEYVTTKGIPIEDEEDTLELVLILLPLRMLGLSGILENISVTLGS